MHASAMSWCAVWQVVVEGGHHDGPGRQAGSGGSSVMVKRVELQKCVGADCSQHEFFDASGVAGLLDSALQG